MVYSQWRYDVWSRAWEITGGVEPRGSSSGVPRSDLPTKRGRIFEAQQVAIRHWIYARWYRSTSQEEGKPDRMWRLRYRKQEKEALARLAALADQWDRLGYGDT